MIISYNPDMEGEIILGYIPTNQYGENNKRINKMLRINLTTKF